MPMRHNGVGDLQGKRDSYIEYASVATYCKQNRHNGLEIY